MTPSELAEWIEVSPNTLRKWAGEFGAYLSPAGAGGKDTDGRNKQRHFDDHDCRVMALINQLSKKRASRGAIDAQLRALRADGWDELPDLPPRAGLGEQAIQVAQKVAQMQLRIAELENQLTSERDKHVAEIIELREQLAEAKTMIRLYESGRLKPTDT